MTNTEALRPATRRFLGLAPMSIQIAEKAGSLAGKVMRTFLINSLEKDLKEWTTRRARKEKAKEVQNPQVDMTSIEEIRSLSSESHNSNLLSPNQSYQFLGEICRFLGEWKSSLR